MEYEIEENADGEGEGQYDIVRLCWIDAVELKL